MSTLLVMFTTCRHKRLRRSPINSSTTMKQTGRRRVVVTTLLS